MAFINGSAGEGFPDSSGADVQFATNTTETTLDMENNSSSMLALKTNINAMFLVIMGSIIIFMQAGFGFLEAGSIRAKNTTSVLIKNYADLTFGKQNDLNIVSIRIIGSTAC